MYKNYRLYRNFGWSRPRSILILIWDLRLLRDL